MTKVKSIQLRCVKFDMPPTTNYYNFNPKFIKLKDSNPLNNKTDARNEVVLNIELIYTLSRDSGPMQNLPRCKKNYHKPSWGGARSPKGSQQIRRSPQAQHFDSKFASWLQFGISTYQARLTCILFGVGPGRVISFFPLSD